VERRGLLEEADAFVRKALQREWSPGEDVGLRELAQFIVDALLTEPNLLARLAIRAENEKKWKEESGRREGAVADSAE
jgi:hypothetical protein